MSDSPAPPAAATPDPRPAPNDEERLMGMLIHLLAALAGFVGPLILWLIKRKESAFIDHNGKEALNFQITFFAVEICITICGVVATFVFDTWAILVTAPVIIITSIAAVVLEILTGLKAHKGAWPRYPICIRLIR